MPTFPTGTHRGLAGHGASMTAQQQDNNTNLRALGAEAGFIVVQPTTDGFSWSAGHETRIMTGLFDVIDAFDGQTAVVFALGGHCYPGSTDHAPTEPGQLAGYGCKGDNAFHFGQVLVEFFLANPKP